MTKGDEFGASDNFTISPKFGVSWQGWKGGGESL